MRLSTEVLHIICANILMFAETIAYLCQCMLNRVRSYSNVRSSDVCVPMLDLWSLFNISKSIVGRYDVFFIETVILSDSLI